MLAEEMYEFRGQLKERGIIFCYSGYMTEDVLAGIGSAIRRKLEIEEADRRTAKILFSVFVEQVQNVIRYSAEGEPPNVPPGDFDLRYGVLTVGIQDDMYFVACGNLVKNADVDPLGAALSHIKALSKEELKVLYREKLKDGPPEGSKGAGVGFIEIARRADNGFDFDFAPMNDEFSYFCLKAYI